MQITNFIPQNPYAESVEKDAEDDLILTLLDALTHVGFADEGHMPPEHLADNIFSVTMFTVHPLPEMDALPRIAEEHGFHHLIPTIEEYFDDEDLSGWTHYEIGVTFIAGATPNVDWQ